MALFGSKDTFAVETTCLPLVPGELYRFEVLEVDGFEDYRIYCIENDAITKMLIADAEHDIRDYRVPRADFSAAMSATIEQLERWLAPTSESAGHNDA